MFKNQNNNISLHIIEIEMSLLNIKVFWKQSGAWTPTPPLSVKNTFFSQNPEIKTQFCFL